MSPTTVNAERPFTKESPMIEIMAETTGSLLALKATGKLTDADYKTTLIPKMEEVIKEYGKADVLMYLPEDFTGWDAHAAWDDTSFGLRHRNDFAKLALVGGPKWVEWATRIGAHLIAGEVKIFPVDHLAEALEWIQAS